MSPPASPSRASPVRSPVAAAVEAAASTRSLEDAPHEVDDASASASASAPSRALVDDLRARLRVAHEDLAAAHERERAHGAGLEHFRDRQAAITAELGRVSELDADLRAARAELADARDAERDARDAEARAVAAEKRAAASETAALARVRELEYAGGDRVVFSDSPGAQIVAKIQADAAERAVDDLVAARGLAPAAMGTPGNDDGSSPESNPSSLVRAAVAEAEARTRDRFAARVETLENQLKDARDQRDREALLRSNPSRADQSSLAGAIPSEDAPESSSPESLIALRRRAEDAESALASSAFELALATTARDALEGELESTREDLAAAREEVVALRRRLATRPSAEAATAAQQQRTPGGGDGVALGAQTATPAPRSLSRLAPEWNTASPSPDAFAGLALADGPSPRPIAVDAADAASAGPSPPSVFLPQHQHEQQQHSARRSVAALVTRAAEEAAERRGLLTPGGGMEWERRLAEAAEAAARDARDQWAEERAALERNVRDAEAAARALEAEAETREAALGRELAALEAEAAALRESTRAANEEAKKARSVVVAKEKGDDEALAALESAAAKLREKNAALREMLAETEADAASFREDAERTRARCAELEKELVEERNAETTSSKPAGAARVHHVEAGSSRAEANTVVSAKTESSSLDGEVDSLRRELEATRRVCSIQEEEVCRATAAAAARAAEPADWTNAEAAASIPRALLERWRGEVFKLLLERRADGSGSGSSPRGGRDEGGGREGIELRSGSTKTDSDEKTSALEAEKAALAAKLDALEARLERAAESESRAKAEAAEARETAAATAAVAAADRSRVRALAESAFALRATFEAKARELRDADERLASMRRRVAFAERRVRSHRAFVDASGGVGTAATVGAAGNERAEAGTSNPPFGTLRSDATSDVVADALASSDARTLAAELRRVESERVSLLRTLGASSRELRASKSALAEARAEASEALRRAAKSDATLEALKSALDAQKAETRDARIKAVDIATRADEKMAEQRRRLERDAEEAAEHAKRSAERSAEAERRSADAERRLAEAEADAAQTRLGLGRDLEAARREATRHAVAARQAERLMAKMRDARAEEDAAKFEALEARCANREEAAEALRRERNALLAEVRATEKQQGKSGGGVKSGGGSNKKAGGAMTREASEASGEEASGFLFPAKSRLGFSPKSPPRRGARRGLRLADGDHRNHAEARRDRGVAATEGIETGAIDRSGGSISPERGVGGGGGAEGGAAAVTLADLEASPSWQLQRRLQSLERRAAALLDDEEEEAAAEAAMLAEAEAVEGAR